MMRSVSIDNVPADRREKDHRAFGFWQPPSNYFQLLEINWTMKNPSHSLSRPKSKGWLQRAVSLPVIRQQSEDAIDREQIAILEAAVKSQRPPKQRGQLRSRLF